MDTQDFVGMADQSGSDRGFRVVITFISWRFDFNT